MKRRLISRAIFLIVGLTACTTVTWRGWMWPIQPLPEAKSFRFNEEERSVYASFRQLPPYGYASRIRPQHRLLHEHALAGHRWVVPLAPASHPRQDDAGARVRDARGRVTGGHVAAAHTLHDSFSRRGRNHVEATDVLEVSNPLSCLFC